jgi:hypothetical protein
VSDRRIFFIKKRKGQKERRRASVKDGEWFPKDPSGVGSVGSQK